MTFYHDFAEYYDELMQDAPYDQWMQFFEETRKVLAEKEYQRQLKIADLGCGTGTMSLRFLEKGYQVFAVDLSEEMLMQAQAKLSHPTPFLRFLQQDVRNLRLPEKVDCAVSFCDSFNYLLEEKDLQAAFQSLRQQLQPGGWFLFDMHSPYKLREVLGNQTFYDIREDIAYLWQSSFDPVMSQVDYDVTFFAQVEGDMYRRFQETHRQRAYPKELIQQLLKQAGFEYVQVGADFSWEEPGDEAQRYFFMAK